VVSLLSVEDTSLSGYLVEAKVVGERSKVELAQSAG
jgi:hypothetical protein